MIINDISSSFDIKNEEVISYYEDNKYDYFEPEKRGSYDLVPFTSEKEALKAIENYRLNNDFEKLLSDRGLEKTDVDQGLITDNEGISEEISN